MNTWIRTYRIRDYIDLNTEEFNKSFLSEHFTDTCFEVNYKWHLTKLTKRVNQDIFITKDDYNSEWIKIYSGIHRIRKWTTIEIEEDTNIKSYDSYYIPNVIEFFHFPKKKCFLTRASKEVFNHAIKWIEKKYEFAINSKEVEIVELVKNETNIIWVNIKPNTTNCDTIVWYWQNVHTDDKIKEIISKPWTFLSNVMIKIPFKSSNVVVTITHDCWIVIYNWNEQLEYDLDLVFHLYETIIKKYLK